MHNSEKEEKSPVFNKYFRFNLENASCHIGISLNDIVPSEQLRVRTLLLFRTSHDYSFLAK